MRCWICGEEITRDMTDINGQILMFPINKRKPADERYICLDCENDSRVDWDDIHEMEMAPD